MNRPKRVAAFLLLNAALIMLSSSRDPAAARPRISTGQDLYEACKVLADYALNPVGPTPRPGIYCRQYIQGYFASMKFVHDDNDAQRALGLPLYSYDCVKISGPHSYDQLAADVVHNAEWQPTLLPQPAIRLAQVAFGAKPPC
ncbi:MAG TPA: hypothetical protein VF449_13055 [Parvibaculum sp.]